MSTKRKGYAWQANDRYYLSLFPATQPDRSRNEYMSREELEQEARQRRVVVEWETEGG